jgi:hypothetical protein
VIGKSIKQGTKSRLSNSWPSYAFDTELGGCVNGVGEANIEKCIHSQSRICLLLKYGCYENYNIIEGLYIYIYTYIYTYIYIYMNSLRQC